MALLMSPVPIARTRPQPLSRWLRRRPGRESAGRYRGRGGSNTWSARGPGPQTAAMLDAAKSKPFARWYFPLGTSSGTADDSAELEGRGRPHERDRRVDLPELELAEEIDSGQPGYNDQAAGCPGADHESEAEHGVPGQRDNLAGPDHPELSRQR